MSTQLPQFSNQTGRDLERLVNKYLELCAICGASRGRHSHEEGFCPNPADRGPLFLSTKFARPEAEYTIYDKVRDEAVND